MIAIAENLPRAARVLVGAIVTCFIFIAPAHAAETASPIRIFTGGSTSTKFFTERKEQLEKLTGRELSIREAGWQEALVSLSKGLIDCVTLAQPIEIAVPQAETATGTRLNPADFTSVVTSKSTTYIALNPESGVKELSDKQIGGILEGKITSWEQVGGKKVPVKVFFAKHLTITNEQALKTYTSLKASPVAQYVIDSEGLLRAIKANPGAFGLIPTKEGFNGFMPVFLPTNLNRVSILVFRKDASPEVKKLAEAVALKKAD